VATIAGREAELALIGRPEGIGKSPLWQAAVDAGWRADFRVVSARPTEAEGQLPFASLNDLLGGLLNEIDPPRPRTAATHALLAVFLTAALAACGTGVSGALRADEVPPPIGFPECNADAYDFAGQGTLRQLGLDKATPVPPPDPDRPAMIWVTHDLKPHDGVPGGEVEMVRMLCFEFPDGSGGSEWPVDPDWRPPIAHAQSTETSNSGFPAALLVAGLTAAVLLTVSLVAFRSTKDSR
jgi:hypothetical protein